MKNVECAPTIFTIGSVSRRNSPLQGEEIMRILIVEDDADLGEFIGKGLREERYAVDLAVMAKKGYSLQAKIPTS